MSDVDLPGRLGDPARSLATDPRADPRLVAALAPFGLDGLGEPPPVTPASPREELLAFCAAAEAGFEAVFAALYEGLAPIEEVESETLTVPGGDDNEIKLYVHRPAEHDGPLACVYHIHGGGMVLLEGAGPAYVRGRDELAATGLVVVGVEYRNGGGTLGPYPYPAGRDDCVAGLRWILDRREQLGVSHVVVSGESGGGNLTIATVLEAKRQGWVDEIAGVYAQCPYISGTWDAPPPALVSQHENDGYFLRCDLMAVLAEVYDPGGAHATDPFCWPYHATVEDVAGLPPFVVSVNELDPLRDEGLAFARTLAAAGVSVVSRTVNATSHAGDLLFPGALPDVHAASVRDVAGFVRAVASSPSRVSS